MEVEGEKGEYKAKVEEGNNGKDTERDQCQLDRNCQSNDWEKEVSYYNNHLAVHWIHKSKLLKVLSFQDVWAANEFTKPTALSCPDPGKK